MKTNLTKTVRATIKDVLAASPMPGSPEMRRIATREVMDNLREDHGIFIRLRDLLRIAEKVA